MRASTILMIIGIAVVAFVIIAVTGGLTVTAVPATSAGLIGAAVL